MIPFVIIELDRPRKLRFGLSAIVEFEQMTGSKVQDLEDEMSFDVLSKLLYVMLKHEQPDLTLKQTIDLVDEYASDLTTVAKKATEAITAAFKTGKTSKNG